MLIILLIQSVKTFVSNCTFKGAHKNISLLNISKHILSATKLIITKLIKLQNLSNNITYENKIYQLQNVSNYKKYQNQNLSMKFINLKFRIMEMFQQLFWNPRIFKRKFDKVSVSRPLSGQIWLWERIAW